VLNTHHLLLHQHLHPQFFTAIHLCVFDLQQDPEAARDRQDTSIHHSVVGGPSREELERDKQARTLEAAMCTNSHHLLATCLSPPEHLHLAAAHSGAHTRKAADLFAPGTEVKVGRYVPSA
jgi:hypothetical protein